MDSTDALSRSCCRERRLSDEHVTDCYVHCSMTKANLTQTSHWYDKTSPAIWRVNEGRTRDSVRGDEWRCGLGEVVRAMLWRKFWNLHFKKNYLKVSRLVTTRLLSAHAWHWVPRISWTFRNGREMARLGTPYCAALREQNSCQCEALLIALAGDFKAVMYHTTKLAHCS